MSIEIATIFTPVPPIEYRCPARVPPNRPAPNTRTLHSTPITEQAAWHSAPHSLPACSGHTPWSGRTDDSDRDAIRLTMWLNRLGSRPKLTLAHAADRLAASDYKNIVIWQAAPLLRPHARLAARVGVLSRHRDELLLLSPSWLSRGQGEPQSPSALLRSYSLPGGPSASCQRASASSLLLHT